MPQFFIPDTIDLDSLVKDIPRPDVKRNVKFGCAYILDHFYQYPKTPKGRDIFEKTGGGVPVTMTILRDQIGSKTADKALNLLQELGMIVRIKNYNRELEKSRVYKIQTSYGNWLPVEIERPSFNKNSNYGSLKTQKANYNDLPFLKKWLTPDLLNVDYGALDFYVQFFYNRLHFEIPNVKTSYEGKKKKEYHVKLKSLLNARFLELTDDFQNYKSLIERSNRSSSNQRFNTVLTQMIKNGRFFLKIGDASLFEIDLSSSQPFFFLSLLQKFEKVQTNSTTTTLLTSNSLSLISTIYPIPKTDHILSTFSNLNFVRLSLEIAKFRDLFLTGSRDFYSNLGILLDEISEPKLPHFSNRERTKKAFMFLLFEQFENDKKRLPVYQVFKKAFPKITEVMDRIKRTKKNRLAIILQKVEAYFMLDVIAKKFASKHPDAPIYTIHDAYLVKESDVEVLDKLIKDELENQVGIRPSTKIKKLSPANLFMDLNKAIDQEIALLKEKARKKKPIESSDYKYFRLFENEIPKWNGEEVMTVSVWAQVQNNPKYRPFLVDKSKMETLKQIREERGLVKSLFQDIDLDQIGSQTELRKQVPPGYTVRHFFDFRESE